MGNYILLAMTSAIKFISTSVSLSAIMMAFLMLYS